MSFEDEDIKKLVEEGLGSIGRLRILRILASGKAFSQTRYSLEKITGLRPVDVRKHLKVLINTGWVKEYDYNPPVYTLNFDNPRARFLLDFFGKIGFL